MRTDLATRFGGGRALTRPDAHDFDAVPLLAVAVAEANIETYDTDEGPSAVLEILGADIGSERPIVVRCPARLVGALCRAAGLRYAAYTGDPEATAASIQHAIHKHILVIEYLGRAPAPKRGQSPARKFDVCDLGLVADCDPVAIGAQVRAELLALPAPADARDAL